MNVRRAFCLVTLDFIKAVAFVVGFTIFGAYVCSRWLP